jgi:hypothetical protein
MATGANCNSRQVGLSMRIQGLGRRRRFWCGDSFFRSATRLRPGFSAFPGSMAGSNRASVRMRQSSRNRSVRREGRRAGRSTGARDSRAARKQSMLSVIVDVRSIASDGRRHAARVAFLCTQRKLTLRRADVRSSLCVKRVPAKIHARTLQQGFSSSGGQAARRTRRRAQFACK